MNVALESIKALREQTGAPLGDVRRALETAKGDHAKAHELLKQRGFEAARKRQARATSAGRIESYVHHDGRVAALVEVGCETDFVARLPEFQQFARDVAMQVASQRPLCISAEQLTPEQRREAVSHGQSEEQCAKEACLLEQPCIKDPGQTIGQLLTALAAKTGENIVVKRFTRFGLGE